MILGYNINAAAQMNPTLGVGLEELTFNKGTFDAELVAKIIREKQKELGKEALKYFILKMFPDQNYATKYYVQNSLHLLLNEKNPQVIEKELLELTTNYALALGIAKVYYNLDDIKYADPEIRKLVLDVLNNDSKANYSKFVDIVSLALSNCEKIRNKGFYKKRVDYTSESTETSKDVIKLRDKITEQIGNYTEHFEIIQEFFTKHQDQRAVVDIATNLIQGYRQEVNLLLQQDHIDKIIKSISKAVDGDKQLSDKVKNYIDSNSEYFSAQQEVRLLENQLAEVNNLDKYGIKYGDASQKLSKILKEINILSTTSTTGTDSITVSASAARRAAIDQLIDEKLKLEEEIQENRVGFQKIVDTLKLNLVIENYVPNEGYLTNLKLKLQSESPSIKKLADANTKLRSVTVELFGDKDFLKGYIKKLLDMISSGSASPFYKQLELPQSNLTEQYADDVAELYNVLYTLYEKENAALSDIKYLEQTTIPNLIKYSLYVSKDASQFKNAIDNFKALSLLLKINAIQSSLVKDKTFFYSKQLDNILLFVSQLDKLDKAETYVSIINLIRENADELARTLIANDESAEHNFANLYILFTNAIKKYTLINSDKQYVEVDVISFLNDLQVYYEKNNKSWFSLYLTLGLSENFFFRKVTFPDFEEKISTVGFASEKLGIKFKLHDFKIRDTVYSQTVKDDVYLDRRFPFINEMYSVVYCSGLLYSLANTATNEHFDYPHVGVGIGVRFYNALDLNLTLGLPFVENYNFGDLQFLSIGLDIPLSEYLERIGKE